MSEQIIVKIDGILECKPYTSDFCERDILCDRSILSCVKPETTGEPLYDILQKHKSKTVNFGKTSICYPNDEKALRLTESCLETVYDCGNPVKIETKSTVLLRDTGLLSMIAKRNGATVCVPIFCDDIMSPVFEKNTPLPSERFEMLERLSSAGIKCGVIISPVIAFFTDSRRNIVEIVNKSANAGVTFIECDLGMLLTEKTKPLFFAETERYFHGISSLFEDFKGNYYSIPRRSFIKEAFDRACEKNKIKQSEE